MRRNESPDVPDFAPSRLVDAVLLLLEGASIPTETNDQIVRLIEAAEAAADEPGPNDPEAVHDDLKLEE